MARRACNGAGLLGAFRAAVANLEANVDEINALNVFPVPDGDTGSNMLATVRAALAEAETLGEDATAERVAAAAAFGALMGARGNSGVITSQILRGIAEGLAGKARFNTLDLANALDLGTKAAYGAVAKPVEGTILTVIREASGAAVATAEREPDLVAVLKATVVAADKAVAKTPSLLQILKDAGVVDSGGQGLLRLFEGAERFVEGGAADRLSPRQRAAGSATPARRAARLPVAAVRGQDLEGDRAFGFETMFLARALPGQLLDVEAIRNRIDSIGESVLVAGDGMAVKVHVHNGRPDLVLGYALGLGTLSMISVENLDQQASDVRETKAAAFTTAAGSATDAHAGNGTGAALEADDMADLAVVAVAAGEGLAAIFRDFGVSRVVLGGQTANPSTGELLEAVRSVHAREVLVLPNNPNVVLAARQVAALADRPVSVVATRNAAEGLAALLALDPTKNAAENATEMTAAGRAVQSLSVTEAVRDATIGGRKVKKGQTIALDPDDGLVAVDDDPAAAVLAAIRSLKPGFELITLYYGEGADLAGTERLARKIHELATGAEVEVVHGGQPHYRYLVSAE
ncbi:MAG TPA: DAK2 domain-containing protein [Candidatus Limnocylindrales bacterium]|nr:DAK2 domain-containing protein [Candidatus Limnocylindrales bacterium]